MKHGFKTIEFYKIDIGDSIKLEENWKRIIEKYQKINIMVCNAAIARGKLIRELSFNDFKKTIDINFLSIVQLT